MASLSNSTTETILRLESRKSFSFALRVRDPDGTPVDVTGCSFEIVMKAPGYGVDVDDNDNLIVNSIAEHVEPTEGFVRFDLQASDLSATPDEYPFVIVMRTVDGYSAVLVKGYIILLENPEMGSTAVAYDDANPVATIDARLRGNSVIDVAVGSVLPPGEHYLTDLEREQLNELIDAVLTKPPFGTAAYENADTFAPADAVVPAGGFQGRVLGKLSNADYHIGWINVGSLGGGGGAGLDATGIPIGFTPIATGTDLWEWGPSVASADDLLDGTTKVAMTVVERLKLAAIPAGAEQNVQANWTALTGDSAILNKPALGSAAYVNTGTFATAAHTHRVMNLDGISYGTADPTGGVSGDLYIKYTP